MQVADLWRLLNNLVETPMRSLECRRSTMSEVAHRRRRRAKVLDKTHWISYASDVAKQQNRDRRLAIYQELRSLIDGGMNQPEAPYAGALAVRWSLPGAEASRVSEHRGRAWRIWRSAIVRAAVRSTSYGGK